MTETEIMKLPEGIAIRLKQNIKYAKAYIQLPGRLVFQKQEDREPHESLYGIEFNDGVIGWLFTADDYELV